MCKYILIDGIHYQKCRCIQISYKLRSICRYMYRQVHSLLVTKICMVGDNTDVSSSNVANQWFRISFIGTANYKIIVKSKMHYVPSISCLRILKSNLTKVSNLDDLWNRIYASMRKKEEIWLSHLTKAPTPTEKKSKKERDNTNTPSKTSITQRLRTDLGR